MKVFVLNMRGKPLMPCSPAKARHMLKADKAFVVRRTPFTIKLTIATGETKQDVTLGVDAGARHVGISATTEKEEVFASEVALRQDITGLLADRLAFRRARRNRKTRYRAPRFNNQQSRSIKAQGMACVVRRKPHSGAHVAHRCGLQTASRHQDRD